MRKHNWAEDRVFFFNDAGDLTSVPAGWTDADPPDPFVVVAAGRSAFRIDDLLALASMIEGVRSAEPERAVKEILPEM